MQTFPAAILLTIALAAGVQAGGVQASGFPPGRSQAADRMEEEYGGESQQRHDISLIPPADSVVFGMSSWAEPAENSAIVRSTIETLRRAFGRDRLEVRQYSLEGLSDAIRANQIDIFQSSAGFYLRHRQHGVRALVTAGSNRFPDPNRSDGATIIVRADRNDIRTLADARGKVLAANSPIGFTGYQVPLGEVARIGGDPDTFFSKKIFTGEGAGMHGVFDALLDGRADVGFLRLCYLENFPDMAGKFRVLNERPASPGSCRRSTDSYPTWTISATSNAPSEVSRTAAAALLSMPVAQNGYYWGIANDYSSIDELFKILRIGPYSYLREWTLQAFVARWWPFIVIAFLLLFGGLLHMLFIERLNRRQAAKLKEALENQARLEERARSTAARIDELQRVGTIGTLSSLVAHELNQPLAAITLYARGLLRLLEQRKYDRVSDICTQINSQAERARSIVEKVRGYARGDSCRQVFSLSRLADSCVTSLEISGRAHAKIVTDLEEGVYVEADETEIEIVLLNLLKNASEALRGVADGKIDVRLRKNSGNAVITMADNGKIFTGEELGRLSLPLVTSKRTGLGLGLTIVRTIIEKHRGGISFGANGSRGLLVTVQLPVAGNENETEGRT